MEATHRMGGLRVHGYFKRVIEMDSWLNALVAMLDQAASRWLGSLSLIGKIACVGVFVVAVVFLERACAG